MAPQHPERCLHQEKLGASFSSALVVAGVLPLGKPVRPQGHPRHVAGEDEEDDGAQHRARDPPGGKSSRAQPRDAGLRHPGLGGGSGPFSAAPPAPRPAPRVTCSARSALPPAGTAGSGPRPSAGPRSRAGCSRGGGSCRRWTAPSLPCGPNRPADLQGQGCAGGVDGACIPPCVPKLGFTPWRMSPPRCGSPTHPG